MTNSVLSTVGATVTATAGEIGTLLLPLKATIQTHFGSNGLIAFYITLGVLAFLLVYKLMQLAFAALKYVVLPSIALAFLATLIFPYSFAAMLPFTVAGCSMILLFKG